MQAIDRYHYFNELMTLLTFLIEVEMLNKLQIIN